MQIMWGQGVDDKALKRCFKAIMGLRRNFLGKKRSGIGV